MAAMTAALLYWYGIPTNVDHGSLVAVVHLLPVWIIGYLAVFSAPLCFAVLLLQVRRAPVTGRDSGHFAPG